MEYKRGVLNRAKPSVVYNASATNLRIIPDFPAVFSYPNVNRWNNSIRFIASQDASKPPRTFVLGGFFYIFIENCANIIKSVCKSADSVVEVIIKELGGN